MYCIMYVCVVYLRSIVQVVCISTVYVHWRCTYLMVYINAAFVNTITQKFDGGKHFDKCLVIHINFFHKHFTLNALIPTSNLS